MNFRCPPLLINFWRRLNDLVKWQNHRMGTDGREHWRALVPCPCSDRVPRTCYWGLCPDSFLVSPGKETPQPLLGHLFQCSLILTVKFFLKFRWNFLCISLCSLPLVPLLSTTKKSLAPFSWYSPFRYLQTLMRSFLSHLFLWLNRPNPVMSCKKDALIIFVALHWTCFRSSMSLSY